MVRWLCADLEAPLSEWGCRVLASHSAARYAVRTSGKGHAEAGCAMAVNRLIGPAEEEEEWPDTI